MLRWLYIQIVAIAVTASCAVAAGFIDTSDSCLSLQSVSGGTVALQPVGRCDGKPGRVYVELQPGSVVDVVVNGVSVGGQKVKGLEVVDVTGVLDRAEKAGKEIKSQTNPHAAAMQGAAEQTKAVYDSVEFQAKLKAEQERIKDATIGDQFDMYYKDAAEGHADGTKRFLGADERLYVFVSASMPMTVIRQYAADVAKLKDSNISLVLRGFIDGMSKITPTANFVAEVLKEKPSCEIVSTQKCAMRNVPVLVDPMLFRRFSVSHVPTFVFAKGVKVNRPDRSEGDANNLDQSGETYRIAGDASLSHVLSRFADASGTKNLSKAGELLR